MTPYEALLFLEPAAEFPCWCNALFDFIQPLIEFLEEKGLGKDPAADLLGQRCVLFCPVSRDEGDMFTFTVFLFLVFNKPQARNVWHVQIGNDYVRACLVLITSALRQHLQGAYGGVGKSKYFISAIIEDFR